jgi:hypothetical protein
VPLSIPFVPILSFPTMNVDIPFLAGLLLKLHAGQTWSADEVVALQSVVLAAAPATPAAATPEESQKPLDAETLLEPILEVPKVKIKTVKEACIAPSVPTPSAPAPAAPAPAAPAEAAPTAVKPLEISSRHCLARMVQKKNVIPGTDANKVYETKQCIRVRAKGELLCSKCEEYYTAYKEKSKGKANWEGFINETPLDHLHVVGSKWFREHYPSGIVSETPDTIAAVPADPVQEVLLAETTPVKEVKWVNIKIGGIQYIYNSLDRRTYRADMTKTGEDQIQWDNYEGKYINGTLDPYAEETEDKPE